MFEAELTKQSRWELIKLMLRSWRTWRIAHAKRRTLIVGNFIPTILTREPSTPPPNPRKK